MVVAILPSSSFRSRIEENSRDMFVSVLQRAVLPLHAPVQPRVVDGDAHPRRDQPQQRPVVFRVGVDARGLHVDHAHQLAARRHGHGQFGAHGVHRVQVARIVAHVAHQHRFAARRPPFR